MPTAGLIIFMIIATAIFVGLHVYIWERVIRAPGLPAPWPTVLTVGLVIMAVGMLALTFSARRLGLDIGNLLWPAWIWMALALFLVLTLFGTDLVRWSTLLVARLVGSDPGLDDPLRREFFARVAAGGATLASVSLAGAGIATALTGPFIKKVRVELARLPASLSGLSIVQITDLHVGHVIGRPYVEEVVRRVNALSPDLVVITGDLVDGTPRRLADDVAPLGEIQARLGIFFVSGNHDYYAGFGAWVPVLEGLGIRVLRNERVSIADGADSFDLAGVEDPVGARVGHGPDLAAALAGRDPNRELVLLAHRPRAVNEAAAHGVGLQLSGHTHGGQIWPFTWMAHLIFPVVAGLARFGKTQLYVSRGTGYVGIPVRLGADAELTRIELVSAAEPSATGRSVL